jgi:hypothetical protein
MYSGELSGRWGQDQLTGTAFGQRAAQQFTGNTWVANLNKIFWTGSRGTPTLKRFGLELSAGGGQQRANWSDAGYGGRSRLLSSFGTGRAMAWLGFIGAGYMGTQEMIDASLDSVPLVGGSLGKLHGSYTRTLQGPVVSLANNNFVGFRVKLEAYHLTADSKTVKEDDSWSPNQLMPLSKTNVVNGGVAEIAMGGYFVRAEQRQEEQFIYSIGERFEKRVTLSGGVRVAF